MGCANTPPPTQTSCRGDTPLIVFVTMARKKAVKASRSDAVIPHRSPNLSRLLERAKLGFARDVKSFLDAGGSTTAVARLCLAGQMKDLPLLFAIIYSHSHCAPQTEVAESIELLVKAGAPVDAWANCEGAEHTAVMKAALCPCCPLLLKTLLQLGADPCLLTPADGLAALHMAASAKGASVEAIKQLVTADPEHRVDLRDADMQSTPLMRAAMNGHLSMAATLHKLGADVNAVDINDYTPLTLAINNGHTHIATCLVRNGADVNKLDSEGCPLLHFAASKGNVECVKLPLEHGADVNIVNADGTNALVIATGNGHAPVMQLLHERGLNLHCKNRDGITVLMVAADNGHIATAQYAISAGAAVNAANDSGDTALHYAAQSKDRADIIKLLIANGADVDACNSRGSSALMCAITLQDEQHAAALINGGANAADLNSKGLSPLFTATEWGLTGTVKLLLEHGAAAVIEAEMTVCAAICCGPITALMVSQQPAIIKLLLAAGADVHKRTVFGNTCLHVAVRHKYPVSIVCLLIRAGADLHAVNNAGRTAAQMARALKYTLVESILLKAIQEQKAAAQKK
jgi:uncharacterized protein